MKKFLLAAVALVALAGCQSDATVATENLKKAADNFEINRRIVFYNGITNDYILSIEGRCSMDLNQAGTAFSVICRTGASDYKRHTLVLSDNTTAFVEQIDAAKVSAYHYRVIFKPTTIIPDLELNVGPKN